MPKFVATALTLYSYFLVEASLQGLPSRIPTHFNLAGRPDRWGSPHTLWMLLAMQVLLASILLTIPTWGRRFPQAVHLGTRSLGDYTLEQRELVMPLLRKMAGFMSVATSLFFVYLIRETIQAAEVTHFQSHQGLALGLFLGSMVGLPLYYVRRMNRVVGARSAKPR